MTVFLLWRTILSLRCGANLNQTDAMAEEVQRMAALAGFEVDHIEGPRNANWTLIDYKGVVVSYTSMKKQGNFTTLTGSGRMGRNWI